jgi:hypothetical protein
MYVFGFIVRSCLHSHMNHVHARTFMLHTHTHTHYTHTHYTHTLNTQNTHTQHTHTHIHNNTTHTHENDLLCMCVFFVHKNMNVRMYYKRRHFEANNADMVHMVQSFSTCMYAHVRMYAVCENTFVYAYIHTKLSSTRETGKIHSFKHMSYQYAHTDWRIFR